MLSISIEIILPLLLFLGESLGQQENEHGFKTQLQVEEHGMKYHQTVEYDPVTTAVTITVPKHGKIDASTVIMHKPSNTQMLMDPLRKYCELKKVPAHLDPQDMALSSQHMAANNQVLSPEIANEVKVTKIRRGKLSLAKRKQLLKSIRDLCESMPIYIVDEIDLTDAEYENGFITLNATHTDKRRFKRQASTVRPDLTFFLPKLCHNLADRCTTYDVPGAYYCQWFISCPRKVEPIPGRPDIISSIEHCKITHFRDDETWKCSSCCDDQTWCEDDQMCRCNSIYSIDTFSECQKRPKKYNDAGILPSKKNCDNYGNDCPVGCPNGNGCPVECQVSDSNAFPGK